MKDTELGRTKVSVKSTDYQKNLSESLAPDLKTSCRFAKLFRWQFKKTFTDRRFILDTALCVQGELPFLSVSPSHP